MTVRTLGERFESGPNALGLVRLLLAAEVLAWHAHSLRGVTVPPRLHWFLADVGVDAFFAISGFVITASWLRRPHLRAFLAARARRLLPGLWSCLVVTSFVIVPLAVRVSGGTVPAPDACLAYVLRNAGVLVTQWSIPGTTPGLVDSGWNGSLWTLAWEAACYLAVAALGALTLLRPRVTLLVVAVAWGLAVAVALLGLGPYDGPTWVWMTLRTALMFGLGSSAYLLRHRIPCDTRLAVALAATVVASLVVVDNYRLLAAPGLVYLCLWVSVRLGDRRWATPRADISYGVYIYGFPLQQALLLIGWHSGWLAFFLVSLGVVIPTAAASWFLVERRFLRRASSPAVATSRRSGAEALVSPT